jgi:hypothetical protein
MRAHEIMSRNVITTSVDTPVVDAATEHALHRGVSIWQRKYRGYRRWSGSCHKRKHGIEPPLLGFTVGLLLLTPRCLFIGLGAPPCQRFGPGEYCT